MKYILQCAQRFEGKPIAWVGVQSFDTRAELFARYREMLGLHDLSERETSAALCDDTSHRLSVALIT